MFHVPYFMIGGVAQLVRASACHAEGRRFESGRPRIILGLFLKIKAVLTVSPFCFHLKASPLK